MPWHIFLVIVIISFTNVVQAQDTVQADTTNVLLHSPKKATYLALVPGLGQIYNKKYWKLPIVYAGFGVITYFAITNRSQYIQYRDAYVCNLNGEQNVLVTTYNANENTFETNVNIKKCGDLSRRYNADQLKSARDYYRRNMELSYIILVAWYGLQILDATVDAHLYYWEVNDDLSLKIEPSLQYIPSLEPQLNQSSLPNSSGFKITVSF